MIFQHTWEKVLDGRKTQTRRIVRPGEDLQQVIVGPGIGGVVNSKKHYAYAYEVGKTYAVQPGRGKNAVGRIRITSIHKEDIRKITGSGILGEGFQTSLEFLWVWCEMHDKPATIKLMDTEQDPLMRFHIPLWIYDRPAEFYQAWAIEFEVVK